VPKNTSSNEPQKQETSWKGRTEGKAYTPNAKLHHKLEAEKKEEIKSIIHVHLIPWVVIGTNGGECDRMVVAVCTLGF